MAKGAREYKRDGRAPIPKSESTSRIMSANRGKNTTPEILLRQTMRKLGIMGYRLHWKKVPGHPDISFVRRKVAVFVNGCFWHRCPYCSLSLPKSHSKFWHDKFERNVERDARKISQLKELDWQVLVAWECQIKDDAAKLAKMINALLTSKKSGKK